MKRIILGIEYNGSSFAGWQWQPAIRTIQQELEIALSKVADCPITVICAGRTDAGVHAFEQIVHFDADVHRDLHAWVLGGNSHLPNDVRILWAKTAVDDFHARYSAIARFYRYIILNRPANSALLYKQTTWCYPALDAQIMNQAAQSLIGEHDFSSFRAQGCQSKSPFRIVHFIDVNRDGEKVTIDICANAFLHHMVRNIAGVLMEIGMGKKPAEWTQDLLAIKSRQFGGVTAPPHGLFLAGVYYPERYGLNKHPIFDKLPSNVKRFD